MSPKKSAAPKAPELRYELTYKNAMNKDILKQSAEFSSKHYGVFSSKGTSPGSSFTTTPERLKQDLWPSAVQGWQDQCLIQAYYGEDDDPNTQLVGQAFVTKWRWQGRQVLWVTHLCVASEHRQKGIAHGLVEQIKDEDPVLFEAGSGVLVGTHGASPVTLQTVARGLAKGGGLAGALKKNEHIGHMADILQASPLETLRKAKVVEADKTGGTQGEPAVVDTGVFVEHPEGASLAESSKQAGTTFVALSEGHEYAVVFEGV